MRRTAVISPGQISLVVEDEEEAMRIAQAIADKTAKCVTLIDANGLELATVKGRQKLYNH
jgi:NAD(P)H-hydrate repair Nnr-like enzyme with NAD(P)H-hydrate dehydratase domain